LAEARRSLSASKAEIESSSAAADDRMSTTAALLRREAEAAVVASADVAARLDRLGQHFEARLGAMSAKLDAAEAGASAAGTSMTSRVAVLTAAADDIRRRIEGLSPVLQELGNHLETQIGAATERAGAAGDAVAARTRDAAKSVFTAIAALVASGENAGSRLTALLGSLAADGQRLEAISHGAEERLQALGEALAQHGKRLDAMAVGIEADGRALDESSRAREDTLHRAAHQLAAEAERMASALREQREVLAAAPSAPPAGDISFLQASAAAIARLEIFSAEIGHALLPPPQDDLAARFGRGDRAVFARALLAAPVADFRRRYEAEANLRAAVDSYVTAFEALASEPARRGLPNVLNAMYLSSDLGRLYVALARSTGRV
jgi:hypothetical protein